jgi:hypothetical protein
MKDGGDGGELWRYVGEKRRYGGWWILSGSLVGM